MPQTLTPDNVQIGARVVCTDDDWDLSRQPNLRNVSFPVVGRTYTIRGTIVTATGRLGVYVLELNNPTLHFDIGGTQEPCFGLGHFCLEDV